MNSDTFVKTTEPKDNMVILSEYIDKHKNIEDWLEKEIEREFGEHDDIAMENPLIRLSVKFDALSQNSKCRMISYAEEQILQNGKEISQRDRFWHLLEKGGRITWDLIEKLADSLIYKEVL